MLNRIFDLFKGFFDSEKVGGLLLIVCTVISLLLANSAVGSSYVAFMHAKMDLSFGAINLNYSIEHWVNDGLMAIFFLMVGLEVERELYIGELASMKKASLPIAAAVGGMLLPAMIHYVFNRGTGSQAGFAIPMATDIAFALGVLALAGNRVPLSVKVFLTALAIIDDIGAIIVIAVFYTKTVLFSYLLAAAGIFVLLLVFNRLRFKNLLIYLLPGVLMWYCLLQSGVHATIAGVLLAFAIPFHENDERNISYRLQHALHKPVAFLVVPIFALVNTAILLPADLGASLSGRNSLGIMTGLVAGKLIGIFCLPFLLVKLGLASMAEDISWKHLAGIGMLGGIGFTMSMFISNLAFADASLVTSSKLSILVGSACSAIAGLALFITGRRVAAPADA
jgi:NhaA family Na+:H+ antiporter